MNMADQTVLVTGINDMVGMHLSTRLRCLGAKVVGIGDLRADIGSLTYLENEIERFQPSFVFHVPGHRYGIAMHRDYPGDVYYESVVSFAHLLEACRKAGVKKVVNVLSNCVYPQKIEIPHREDEMWDGLPEETLIPHGMARRVSIVHGAAYRAQHGLSTISVVLASVYGSNDNFDPKSAQVMASMITRFVKAVEEGKDKVVCWGSGNPTREFIHVRDAAIGLIHAAAHYDDDMPLNVGSQNEISIRDLTGTIAKCAGYDGKIEWDTSKPEGRARVCLDCSRMRELLPEWTQLSIEEGVRETMDWYRRMEPTAG
jgi:GDP-L-fucose synthase